MGADPNEGLLIGGRYRIVRPLGRGGMGAVYEGVQLDLGRRVAIKLLLDVDASSISRFRQEALAAAAVHHPNVAQVTDLVVEGDAPPALIGELLEGETLKDLLAREHRLPPARAVRIAQQMLGALGAAHAGGIIHRDVKPANVFLVRVPHSPDFVKLLDFGIAKLVDRAGSHRTTAGAMVGTPAYMAPEQMDSRPPDARTDIHAVGVCLFEMLSGERAFGGGDLSRIVDSVRSHRPRRLTEVPAPLADAIERSLAKDPYGRFATASDMAAALTAAIDEAPDTMQEAPSTIAEAPPFATVAHPHPHALPPPPPTPATTSSLAPIVIGLVLVAFAVAIGGIYAALPLLEQTLAASRRDVPDASSTPQPPQQSPPIVSPSSTAVAPIASLGRSTTATPTRTASSLPTPAPTPIPTPTATPTAKKTEDPNDFAPCRCDSGGQGSLCLEQPKCHCSGGPNNGWLCFEPAPIKNGRSTCSSRERTFPGKRVGDACEAYYGETKMTAAIKDCDRNCLGILRKPKSIIGTPCEGISAETLETRRGTWQCM